MHTDYIHVVGFTFQEHTLMKYNIHSAVHIFHSNYNLHVRYIVGVYTCPVGYGYRIKCLPYSSVEGKEVNFTTPKCNVFIA